MRDTQRPVIDFDEWASLAQNNPDGFEARRRAVIESLIEQAPESRQQHLRCLQWRIDQERRAPRTPLAACIRMSRMMWDKVSGPHGLLDSLETLGQLHPCKADHAEPTRIEEKLSRATPPSGSD